mmetsp:Transcript_11737/g.26772  ORF Transcript_11737/g.26772 Transcript_11737/m.26772 type:complete len:309 (-) Transcript_11737:157-1083(-)
MRAHGTRVLNGSRSKDWVNRCLQKIGASLLACLAWPWHPKVVSLVAPIWLPLLDEGLETLAPVVQAPGRVEEATLQPEALSEGRLLRRVYALLGKRGNRRRHRGDLLCRLDGLVQDSATGEDLRHEARLLGLGSSEHVPREDQLHRLGLAHGADEPLRAADARNGAQLNFGLAEFGILRGKDDVARHGQLTAASQRETIDRSDDGLPDGRDSRPVRQHVPPPRVGVTGSPVHLLDVCTSGESFANARHHGCTHGVVGIDGLELRHKFVHEGVRQGVQGLGSVQGQHGHCCVALLKQHELIPCTPAEVA